MAVAGAAGTAYRYLPHGAAADVCRSMAFPTPRGGGSGSSLPENSRPYSSGFAASSFSPAFAAAASGALQQQPDILDYLSDDGVLAPSPEVPETLRAPLPRRMPVEAAAPVVPDAGYAAHHPR
jgi:hypothetical protein